MLTRPMYRPKWEQVLSCNSVSFDAKKMKETLKTSLGGMAITETKKFV